MLSYTIRRLLYIIPILLGVIFIVTLTLDLIPGDPAALILGEFATAEAVANLRTNLGLDQPLLVRYGNYIVDVVQGDLGMSMRERRPVSQIIGEAFPATAQLAAAAMAVVIFVGIPLGIIAAARPGSFIDNFIRIVSLIGLSMPVFWTGIVFVVIFSVTLGWFPVSGSGSWRHLVLPAVTLALPSLGILARITRTSVLDVLQEDYVRTATAKGVSRRSVLFKHALRNALVPIVTVIGLQLGNMLGGSILTETVFAWPRIGRQTVFAIFNRDFILIQGIVLVFAAIYVGLNLLVDLSYGLLDPRIDRKSTRLNSSHVAISY